ncbi:MAG: alcohol dehydrogenase catalytic domain-containing protein [Bacteroidetes bacterium]|nr:alcohol dehydrogenase catalytic domain-containing protein [Bacteroidota bacterium]
MRALVKTRKGKGFIELKDVPAPSIGDSEVLIDVKACGICGTDLHIYHDEFPYYPPVILGHEFSGTIAAVGRNVQGWAVGDRVVGEPHTMACGVCALCRTGNRQSCPHKRSPGWGIDGAFASLMRWPEPGLLHRIPDNLDFPAAALTEPLANVVTDVVLTQSVMAGDVVAVAGPGPIGIMATLVAKYAGASTVIIFGVNEDEESRLSLCRSLPAIDHVVNVQKEDLVALVQDVTSGRGVDLFIEASGARAAMQTGAQIIRKLGTVTAIGLTGKPSVEFPYDAFLMKSVRYLFNVSTKYESWDRAVRILTTGVIPHDRLISHRGSIDQWQDFFDALLARKALKGMFLFSKQKR